MGHTKVQHEGKGDMPVARLLAGEENAKTALMPASPSALCCMSHTWVSTACVGESAAVGVAAAGMVPAVGAAGVVMMEAMAAATEVETEVGMVANFAPGLPVAAEVGDGSRCSAIRLTLSVIHMPV